MTNEFDRYYTKMYTILGVDVRSDRMVRRWAQRFLEGREDISDDPRSARSISVLTEENIERVRHFINNNPHSAYNNIIAETSLSFMLQ